MRGEFSSIEAAFDKLPNLNGVAGQIVVVNAGGTGLTTSNNVVLNNTSLSLAIINNSALNNDTITFSNLNHSRGNNVSLTLSNVNNSALNNISLTFANFNSGSVNNAALNNVSLTFSNFNTGTINNLVAPLRTSDGGTNINAAGTANNVLLSDGNNWRSGYPVHTALCNALVANVNINNGTIFFNGPFISQGTVGTWLVTSTLSAQRSGGGTTRLIAQLTDMTTVFAESQQDFGTGNGSITVSGLITSPAGNIVARVADSSAAASLTASVGNNKASTISAVRVA